MTTVYCIHHGKYVAINRRKLKSLVRLYINNVYWLWHPADMPKHCSFAVESQNGNTHPNAFSTKAVIKMHSQLETSKSALQPVRVLLTIVARMFGPTISAFFNALPVPGKTIPESCEPPPPPVSLGTPGVSRAMLWEPRPLGNCFLFFKVCLCGHNHLLKLWNEQISWTSSLHLYMITGCMRIEGINSSFFFKAKELYLESVPGKFKATSVIYFPEEPHLTTRHSGDFRVDLMV